MFFVVFEHDVNIWNIKTAKLSTIKISVTYVGLISHNMC